MCVCVYECVFDFVEYIRKAANINYGNIFLLDHSVFLLFVFLIDVIFMESNLSDSSNKFLLQLFPSVINFLLSEKEWVGGYYQLQWDHKFLLLIREVKDQLYLKETQSIPYL